jgi:hypothetical protein
MTTVRMTLSMVGWSMRRIVVHNHLIVSGRIIGSFLLGLTLLFAISPAEARHHYRRSEDHRDWTERKSQVQQAFWPPACDFLFHCEQGVMAEINCIARPASPGCPIPPPAALR